MFYIYGFYTLVTLIIVIELWIKLRKPAHIRNYNKAIKYIKRLNYIYPGVCHYKTRDEIFLPQRYVFNLDEASWWTKFRWYRTLNKFHKISQKLDPPESMINWAFIERLSKLTAYQAPEFLL